MKKTIYILKKIVVFAAVLSAFLIGLFATKVGFTSDIIKPIVLQKFQFFSNIVQGLSANPNTISIRVEGKDLELLLENRKKALAQSKIETHENSYFDGEVIFNGDTFPASIRLKGDGISHIENETKWSFRVKLKGDGRVFGMKKFSLQHPKARNYLFEWVYHEALKREGVIALRYEFLELNFNSVKWGVYALEEHFDKYLIENNNQLAGPILKFSEDFFWRKNRFPKDMNSTNERWYSSYIDSYEKMTYKNMNLHLSARALLEAHRNGKISTSDAFNSQKLAKYMAISDLMDGMHSMSINNQRFYYNPVTSKLEPIGFDKGRGFNIVTLIGTDYRPEYWTPDRRELFFNDLIFTELYIKELHRISGKLYLDSLLSDLEDRLNENKTILYSEFPYMRYTNQYFKENQKFIREMLAHPSALYAHLKLKNQDIIEITVANAQMLPLELLGLKYKDSIFSKPRHRSLIQSKKSRSKLRYLDYSFLVNKKFNENVDSIKRSDLKLVYKILGLDSLREIDLSKKYREGSVKDISFIRQRSNIENFSFIEIDSEKSTAIFKKGNWVLSESLILPEKYQLIIKDSTTIDLVDSSMILCNGKVDFLGTQDNPIRVYSTDHTGQGLVVLNAWRDSKLAFTNFEGMSSPSKGNWRLSGAVTFYESNVTLYKCIFSDNSTEDALNIKNSNFSIESCSFINISSDAFDADYCNGKIYDVSFLNCGNDAIDFSGSEIIGGNIYINGAGDKAISIGESSKFTIGNTKILNSEIACTSKDLSILKVDNLILDSIKLGFVSFEKKPEFGGATISINELSSSNINKLYLLEKGSSIDIDQVNLMSNSINVFEKLYGNEFGKKSN
tara:strand:- start:24738 stop:27275 length:2538 start_codon:yes stop_codon:yes gene_type:complete